MSSSSSSIQNITVQRTIIQGPVGGRFYPIGMPTCIQNPIGCCMGSAPTQGESVIGTSGTVYNLTVEYTNYQFPWGTQILGTFCVVQPVCCAQAESASGSGSQCGPIVTACCPEGLPSSIQVDLVGSGKMAPLTGTYVLHWDGISAWILSGLTLCKAPHSSVFISCTGGNLSFNILCEEGSEGTIQIPLTVSNCCPLQASGSVTTPTAGSCFDCFGSGTLTASVGAAGDTTGGSTDGLILTVEYTVVQFPAGYTIVETGCSDGPFSCCEGTAPLNCCIVFGGGTVVVPKALYVLIEAPNCPLLNGVTIPINYANLEAGACSIWVHPGAPAWYVISPPESSSSGFLLGAFAYFGCTADGNLDCLVTGDYPCGEAGFPLQLQVDIAYVTAGGAIPQTPQLELTLCFNCPPANFGNVVVTGVANCAIEQVSTNCETLTFPANCQGPFTLWLLT